MIEARRRLHDGVGEYVVSQLVKGILKKRIQLDGASVLIMVVFKESCPNI